MNISEIYDAFEAVLGAYQDACNDSPNHDCEECGAFEIPIDKEIVANAEKALQEIIAANLENKGTN